MILYRFQATGANRLVAETRFRTSLVKAKQLVKEHPDAIKIEIHKWIIQDRLSAENWIWILEADSPGQQEIEHTPVDFLIKQELVWSKDQTSSGS